MKAKQLEFALESFDHDDAQAVCEDMLSGKISPEEAHELLTQKAEQAAAVHSDQQARSAQLERSRQLEELCVPLDAAALLRIDERVASLLQAQPQTAREDVTPAKRRPEPGRLRWLMAAVPAMAVAAVVAIVMLRPLKLPEYDSELSDPLADNALLGASSGGGDTTARLGSHQTSQFRANSCLQVLLRPYTRLSGGLLRSQLQVSAFFARGDTLVAWPLTMKQAETGTLHTKEPCAPLPRDVERGDWQLYFLIGTDRPQPATAASLREAASSSSSPQQNQRVVVRQVHID